MKEYKIKKVKPLKMQVIDSKGREIENIVGIQAVAGGLIIITEKSVYTNVKKFLTSKK